MVHERSPHERWQEHWRAVMQHGAGIATEAEKKINIHTWLVMEELHRGSSCHTYHVGR
jgi:hypothetical protein